MSRLLDALFGRLPICWLQQTHNRTRFAAALAGVAFANVLVFVQVGIMNSMATATLKPYGFFQADIMIAASDANSMTEGSNVARQWMFQALADPAVVAGMGLFIGTVSWQRADNALSLITYDIDPTLASFLSPDIVTRTATLRLPNSGVLDRATRGLPRDEAAAIRPQSPLSFEAGGTTLTLYDTFAGGGGFDGDRFMMVSDQTFLVLFPERSSGAPDHILLRVAAGTYPDAVAGRLRDLVLDKSLRIQSYAAAANEDLNCQQTKRPTGSSSGSASSSACWSALSSYIRFCPTTWQTI